MPLDAMGLERFVQRDGRMPLPARLPRHGVDLHP